MPSRYYFEDERPLRRAARFLRSRDGFAWGAFFLGFVLGALIF